MNHLHLRISLIHDMELVLIARQVLPIKRFITSVHDSAFSYDWSILFHGKRYDLVKIAQITFNAYSVLQIYVRIYNDNLNLCWGISVVTRWTSYNISCTI